MTGEVVGSSVDVEIVDLILYYQDFVGGFAV